MMDFEFCGSVKTVSPLVMTIKERSGWSATIKNPYAGWRHSTVIFWSKIAGWVNDDYWARIRHSGSTEGWMVKSVSPYSLQYYARWKHRSRDLQHYHSYNDNAYGFFVAHLPPEVKDFQLMVNSEKSDNKLAVLFFPD